MLNPVLVDVPSGQAAHCPKCGALLYTRTYPLDQTGRRERYETSIEHVHERFHNALGHVVDWTTPPIMTT